MRFSYFCATSIVAILAVTQPASAAILDEVNQRPGQLEKESPIVYTQNDVVTETDNDAVTEANNDAATEADNDAVTEANNEVETEANNEVEIEALMKNKGKKKDQKKQKTKAPIKGKKKAEKPKKPPNHPKGKKDPTKIQAAKPGSYLLNHAWCDLSYEEKNKIIDTL